MKTNMSPLLLSLSLSLLIYTANAFNITQLLSQHPEFSSFSSYLTQTNLATEINARQTITVLAVDNANVAPLSSKPLDLIKNILAVHVILDYFDAPKLQTMAGSSALVTTLFQATGLARGQQGFLNVTRIGSGGIAFGSAMPGSPINSNLVKSVVLQPYNISILQVSSAIIPQGIDGSKTSSPPSVTPGATATPPPPPPPSSTPATHPPVSSLVAPPVPPTNSISFPDPFAVPPTPSAVPIPSTAPPTPSSASVPSTAPPTPSRASVPSTAPPTPSRASVPSAAPPTPSRASIPSAAPPTPGSASVPSTAPPTLSKAAPVPSKAGGPALASTPSATPASTPTASALGPALGPASAPTMGVGAPTAEEPGTTTPAAGKPKSAGTTLDVGLAVVLTMVLSAFYLTSTI